MDKPARKAAMQNMKPMKSGMTGVQRRQASKTAKNILGKMKSKSANKSEIGF